MCDRKAYNVSMSNKWMILLLATSVAGFRAYSSGFGLYEMSAKAHALGGAVVGEAVDASAVFYNPATLSDLTNVTVTVGFVTEHPRARMKVDGGSGSTAMDSGLFWLPHVNLAVPLPWNLTLGLGCAPEFGLGSAFDENWELVSSSQETTVESLTFAPTLSAAVTEDWSVGAGARLLWFDFEQYSEPVPGRLNHRLKGDNGVRDCGWQVGTRLRVRDDLSLGLVYKSQLDVHVRGKSDLSGLTEAFRPAKTKLTMPDSVTFGANWDVTDAWHLGSALTWTHWSTIGTLDFNLGGTHTPCELDWEDTWRVTFAPSYDFAENWTWLFSYAYETDCTGGQKSTMLPAADRHMLATGLAWRCGGGFEVTFDYGLIVMGGKTSRAADATGTLRNYEPHRGLSHAVGLTVTYRF